MDFSGKNNWTKKDRKAAPLSSKVVHLCLCPQCWIVTWLLLSRVLGTGTLYGEICLLESGVLNYTLCFITMKWD